MGGVIVSRSLRVAVINDRIVQYIRNKYNYDREGVAEQIKIKIGSAYPLPQEKTTEARGRNLVNGYPNRLSFVG